MRLGNRQSGLTFVSFIIAAALVAFVALVLLKLFPLYNESFKVKSAMASVAERNDVGELSAADIRELMLRNFEVQDVDDFTAANMREHLTVGRAPDGRGRLLTFQYERRAPLFGNLDVVLKFDESKPIAGVAEGP